MVSNTIKKCLRRSTLYFGVVSSALMVLSFLSVSGATYAELETGAEILVSEPIVTTSSNVVECFETLTDVTEADEPRVTTSSNVVECSETLADVTEADEPKTEKSTSGAVEVKSVPNDLEGCRSEFKAYMSYTAVTNTASKQYKLLNGVSAYTDAVSGIRMVDGRYCVALGSYYTKEVGTKVDLKLTNGTIIPCILGDCKSDTHTDNSNRYCMANGGVAEFIVDYSVFRNVKDSSGTVNFVEGFSGEIESISIIE